MVLHRQNSIVVLGTDRRGESLKFWLDKMAEFGIEALGIGPVMAEPGNPWPGMLELGRPELGRPDTGIPLLLYGAPGSPGLPGIAGLA